jgi:hypothetical protein
MRRRTRLTNRVIAAALLTFSVAACSSVRWVRITGVSTDADAPTTLGVTFDACTEVSVRVIETDSEVRLIVDKRHDYAGDQKDCAMSTTVELNQPIGERTVIDDRYDRSVKVQQGG